MPSREEEQDAAQQAVEGEADGMQAANEPIERLQVSRTYNLVRYVNNACSVMTIEARVMFCSHAWRALLNLSHLHAELGSSPVQEMGIAAADIKKLREASYHVIEAVAHATKRELLLVKGLSEAKVNKIKEAGMRFEFPALAHAETIRRLLVVFGAGHRYLAMLCRT